MQYMTDRSNRVNEGLLDFPRSVEDLFSRYWGGAPAVRAWTPAVDLIETPQAYVLRAEVPGIDPDKIDVTLTGDTLTIRGEKPVEDKQNEESWCLHERMGGRFERNFRLPALVSTEDVEAEVHNGVLTVRVMKAKEAQPRKITIRDH